jgi:chromosome segregation ATPase
LAREKGHADKLKARISDLSASIARKEVEYQDTKKSYEALARSNRKFEEGATKFREIYIRVENLEKEKMKYQEELAELRPNVQETQGKLSMLKDVLADTQFLQTPMNSWRSVSRTSTPISPSNGMSDGARKPMNKIKMMNSLPLERSM